MVSGLGVRFGIGLGVGFFVGFLLGLFDDRRPFGSGLLHDGLLGDSPRLDAGGREIADNGRGLSRLGIGFGSRLAFPLGLQVDTAAAGASALGLTRCSG